ncbi:hypothetical protein PoB_004986400 [Plakobranchus ocellatus]|uniref:Uncharacterized protein n=1 Tax=Plakobranchus ocellatus TaxID=259542 RepID=A0AAV4BT48_9GAST|nr:hypothetical protein PoB_004986400 [Plakobranchus ocellatus]
MLDLQDQCIVYASHLMLVLSKPNQCVLHPNAGLLSFLTAVLGLLDQCEFRIETPSVDVGIGTATSMSFLYQNPISLSRVMWTLSLRDQYEGPARSTRSLIISRDVGIGLPRLTRVPHEHAATLSHVMWALDLLDQCEFYMNMLPHYFT